MPVGLGAGGAVGIAHETVAGTYVAPAVWVPIISEDFTYNEDKYYSEAIRQLTVVSDVKNSYYHIEGSIVMEVDTGLVPYFLYATRCSVTKTGAATPWTYVFTPNSSASTTPKTLSITIIRNAVNFKYTGCVVGSQEWTVENGVLRVTFGMVGRADVSATDVTAVGTPTWPTRSLLGATAHNVAVATANTTPNLTTNVVNDFNGFTATINDNAEAQNRIMASRAAAYISFGITEATITGQLDFQTRAEYDNFVAVTTRAVRFNSANSANDSVDLLFPRTAYDAYGVQLGSMGDLIMADMTARVLQGTPAPYQTTIVGPVNIT